jgi:hypothetical protein
MKQSDSLAGGQTLFSLWTSRFASATVLAALALIAAPAAKAEVWTFDVSGSFQFPEDGFTGTINVDFTNPTNPTVKSMSITVQGLPAYNQSPILSFAIPGNQAVVEAGDGSLFDVLTLTFTTPDFDTLASFNGGAIIGGLAVSGLGTGVPEVLLDATGVIALDPSDPPIPAPSDPPTVAVPELSTWAMMLIGLAGLCLATKGRRAIGFLGGKA